MAGRVGIMAIVAVVIVVIPLVSGPGTTLEYTAALIYGIIAISLVVLTGWSGNVSLGQFAFAGVGGVLAGDLIEKANVDLFLSLAAAGAAGALLAVVVGIPALRIRGAVPGRRHARARRGHGHLLPEPDLLPEHHSAGLPAPRAVAALRPGLEQGLLLLLPGLPGADDPLHSGTAPGPVGPRPAGDPRQREGGRRHVGAAGPHQAGRLRAGRRHRRHRRWPLRRPAGRGGLQHLRPVLRAGRVLHGRDRRPGLHQRGAHGGGPDRGAELLLPQVPAGVHRGRVAARPALPPRWAGRRRAEHPGPPVAVWPSGARSWCPAWWRTARWSWSTTLPWRHPSGARAERGRWRQMGGGTGPSLFVPVPDTRDEDTARVPRAGAGSASASAGRRAHPGQPGRAVVPAGRGLLRPGADPLRGGPRRARGRDRGPARHQRCRQVDVVEGRQRSGQGGRRRGVARRRTPSPASRPRPWPAGACR